MHQRLYDGEDVVVMRRGHPLAGHPISLDDFCRARPLRVSVSDRPFGCVDEALAARARQRRVALTANPFFTAAQGVASTDLLAVLARHFVSATGVEHRQAEHDRAQRWLRQAIKHASAHQFAAMAPANPGSR